MNKIEQDIDVIRHFSGVLKDWELAELLGLTLLAVRYYAYGSGISLNVLKKRWSDEEDAALVAMLRSGMLQREAANAIGRTERAVGSRVTHLRQKGRL